MAQEVFGVEDITCVIQQYQNPKTIDFKRFSSHSFYKLTRKIYQKRGEPATHLLNLFFKETLDFFKMVGSAQLQYCLGFERPPACERLYTDNLYFYMLHIVLFIPKKFISNDFFSAVYICSTPVYGQQCGQKYQSKVTAK